MTSILYLGGTGTISAACVRQSVERGHDVTVVNRGSARRDLPDAVTALSADVRDPAAMKEALGGREFDAVADFLSFSPADVATALEVFEGRTGQYVFISSASAYQKPPAQLPVNVQGLLSLNLSMVFSQRIVLSEISAMPRTDSL